MLLKDCILDADVFLSAPFERDEPEERWTTARDSGAIPPELYDLYRTARFLSFRAGPRFLTDDRNVLFSYFSILLNCLVDALVTASEQVTAFASDQNLTYDLGKKLRGEHWDPQADVRARRHFRDLLIALDGSLDTVADITAIFLTGRIGGLQLGRGDFLKIEQWLGQPLRVPTAILTPYDSHQLRLYDELKRLVLPGPPEKDWLPLMHMLRNKSIHLGQATLRQIGLHDASRKFFVFLPRKWPFIWESDTKPAGSTAKSERSDMPSLLDELLVHQDIVSYTDGLQKKVFQVVQAAISEILSMYRAFKDFDTNEAAIAELDRNSVTFEFENFVDK